MAGDAARKLTRIRIAAAASVMTPAASSLRGKVVRGLGWSISTTVFVQVTRFGFGLLLARLLTPREYGIAGMALVFSALVLTLSDLALGVGLVQRSRINEADRSTVFWLTVFVGVVLTVIGVALSGPLAAFFDEPDVQPMFVVLSFTFIVTALGRVPAALFHREMDFRAISSRVILSTLIASVAGVGVAAAGFGAWALIVQHAAMTVASTALLWVFCPWRPRLIFSMTSLRDLGGFGLKVSATRVVGDLTQSSDKLLVGRFLGSTSLGFYSLAASLVFFPVMSVLTAVNDTIFPALARIQDQRERVSAAWLRASRFTAIVVAPAMLGLVAIAPDFVGVVLGGRWKPITPVLQILALTAVVLACSGLGLLVLTALGDAGTVLRVGLLEFALVVGAVAGGLRGGMVGVAASYLAGIVLTRVVVVLVTTRALDLPIRAFMGALAGVLQAATAMAVCVAGARFAMIEAGLPAAVRLPIAVLIGVAVYVPLCFWWSAETRIELRNVVRHRSIDAVSVGRP